VPAFIKTSRASTRALLRGPRATNFVCKPNLQVSDRECQSRRANPRKIAADHVGSAAFSGVTALNQEMSAGKLGGFRMFNLNDILQSAQGGQAINNLAKQFGLSPEQAQAAVQALLPALSAGLAKAATQPGALGAVISAITDSDHQASYSNPAAAQSPTAVQKGNDALSQILGSSHIVQQIAQQASRVTGLRADLLVQMLPVIVSTALGGLATSLHNQGLGGVLGQLASAVEQGNVGTAGGSGTGTGTGLIGILTNLLGSLFGGAKTGDTSSVNSGLNTLTQMFRTGSLPASITQSGLQESIDKILSSGKP
jgi:hypothetical protein